MEIESSMIHEDSSKEQVKVFVRQQCKAYIADRLLSLEKVITQRYVQSGRPVPSFVSEGTMRVFHEFDVVCDKYITMFELYSEKNIYPPHIPEMHVSSIDECSEEEKELDRKLKKRKHELLECRRKKNILELQRQLIVSDFGKALSRLGAIARELPMDRFNDDLQSLQNYPFVCQSARVLIESLRHETGQETTTTKLGDVTNGTNDAAWIGSKEVPSTEMIQGLMKCFDEVGFL